MNTPPDLEIPPEPSLPYRLYWGGFEHHATAMGYVCFTYASLEGSINRAIEAAVPCTSNARRAIVDASGNSIENRCNLFLKLISLRNPGEGWFNDVEALLNRVKGELAPERNRLIHDQWIGGETISQSDERAFLQKSQARQPKTLSPTKQLERELAAIWDLVRRIQEVDSFLSMTLMKYRVWLQSGQLPEFPSLPDEVRKRTDPTRNQTQKEDKPPPPQSSEG